MSVVHEFGHALGLWHEQCRNDRDNYVYIHYENIDPDAVDNFNKAGRLGIDTLQYDYGSIMHYSAYAFSINGEPTIETIPPGIPIGQRDGLSSIDIATVQIMYPVHRCSDLSIIRFLLRRRIE
jgi:astacin